MAMTPEEKRAYQRGYNAGRKRTEKDIEELRCLRKEIFSAKTEKRTQIFCAALNGVLATPKTWKLNGEPVNASEKYIRLARIIAIEAEKII